MRTATRRHVVPPLAMAVFGVGLVLTPLTHASHPRPQSAPRVVASLVVAYEPCVTANRRHGPPLDRPSCNPPQQASEFVTVGTPTANGAASSSTGYAQIRLVHGTPNAPNEAEVRIAVRITDVRCKPATSTCGNANAAGGPDYSGNLEMRATLRLTDHYNSIEGGSTGKDPATLVDLPQLLDMPCVSTADTSSGSICGAIYSSQSASPVADPWYNGKRMVVGVAEIQVFDGGADGWPGSEPNTLFMGQGIFIP